MNQSEDCYHLGVKALIRNATDDVLLLKVNTEKLSNTKEPYWDIPGGRVQRGGTVEDTLIREIEEETGLTDVKVGEQVAMVLSNIRIPLDPQDVGLILAVYACEIASNAMIQISDEHTEYAWFSPNEAADLLAVKYPAEFTERIKIQE